MTKLFSLAFFYRSTI